MPMIATFLREVVAKDLFEAGCNDISINLAELASVRNALKRLVPISTVDTDTPKSCLSDAPKI